MAHRLEYKIYDGKSPGHKSNSFQTLVAGVVGEAVVMGRQTTCKRRKQTT